MTITAKIIADSVSAETGKRITTLQLRYPRFIHAEFMTHRAFSRNASSSRAIPIEKLIQDIIDDTAMPIHWGANQKGMQADVENNVPIYVDDFKFDPSVELWFQEYIGYHRVDFWRRSRDRAIVEARALSKAGYHKQIVNRILEPYAHINVVVTATEWANFFVLRDHKAAQPEIRELAIQIKNAMGGSTPIRLKKGQWHLPYVSQEEQKMIWETIFDRANDLSLDYMIRLSVARCASVSYMTVEGDPMTAEKAQEIYDKLLSANPIHASPAEHQATPDSLDHQHGEDYQYPELHGNFVGFIQYRKTLDDECIDDDI